MQEDCLATIVFSSDRRMVAEKETIALSAITQLLSRGAQPARPRKLRRDRCKSKVQQLLEMLTIEQGPDEVIHAIQAEAQRNKYSRTLCQSLLDDWFSHNGDARSRLAQSTAAHLAHAEPGHQDDGCRAMMRFAV